MKYSFSKNIDLFFIAFKTQSFKDLCKMSYIIYRNPNFRKKIFCIYKRWTKEFAKSLLWSYDLIKNLYSAETTENK